MFKKGEKESNKSFLETFVKEIVFGKLKEHFDNMMDNIHDAIVITQQKLIRSIMSMLLMLIGFTFVILGGTFYLIDVLKIQRSTIYLVIGFVLVLISIILAQSAKLLKYDFKK